MTGSNLSAITESLERSLQKFSLNNNQNGGGGGEGAADIIGFERSSSTSDAPLQNSIANLSEPSLELNSQISLPYHWEQCLDLQTGEIYYINWMNGMKAKEDPRRISEYNTGDYYSEEEHDDDGDDGDDDDDESSYDSEDSSSGSSPYLSSEQYRPVEKQEDHVLVVAGCKSCLMYYMVPKQDEDCPKCTGRLLHFDRSENASSP